MKRKDFITLTTIAPVALALSQESSAKQGRLSDVLGRDETARPTRTKGSAADSKELEGAKSERFDLSSLSPAERQQATQIADATCALLAKAVLHRNDPQAYPLSKDPRSLEALANGLIGELSPKALSRAQANIKISARLRRHLGAFSDVDLKKELNPATLRVSPNALRKGSSGVELVPRSGNTYNRVDLILRRLHCIEETDPKSGDDDMVLGGLLIGASGNVAKMLSVPCGQFNSGDVTNFGELLLGYYNMNATSGFPKTFYAIFMLVESDSDDAEVAHNLTVALKKVATLVVTAFAGGSVGSMVGAIIDAVGKFIGLFFDEDFFPPHGVRLTLNSPNDFGGADSPLMRTEVIRGHGGRYRIGYRWHLTRT